MADDLDPVARYGLALGVDVRPRTVLVEGTTDVDLFTLASRLEREETGVELLDANFTIVAAGQGDAGGTRGVVRELIGLRALAKAYLTSIGRPRYRFVALFDGDSAGRYAIGEARGLDTSILEFKDVFRLWPVMPMPGSLDPTNMQRDFERANEPYRGLDWELEDLLPQEFVDAFVSENGDCVPRTKTAGGKVHRDFTRDGKAKLHRFVRLHSVRDDLSEVIAIIRALRFYLSVK